MENKIQQIIDELKLYIKEHEESGFHYYWEQVELCTDAETALYAAYDVGRFDTLNEILNYIQKG